MWVPDEGLASAAFRPRGAPVTITSTAGVLCFKGCAGQETPSPLRRASSLSRFSWTVLEYLDKEN